MNFTQYGTFKVAYLIIFLYITENTLSFDVLHQNIHCVSLTPDKLIECFHPLGKYVLLPKILTSGVFESMYAC